MREWQEGTCLLSVPLQLINLDCLVKVMSARFLYSKITDFSLCN